MPAGRVRASCSRAVSGDRDRHVRVADEHERVVGEVERAAGVLDRQDVVPDRVGGARVEERDALPVRRGAKREQELAGLVGQLLPRPAGGRGGVRVELRLRDAGGADGDEVVVADEPDVRPSLDRGRGVVGARPVADRVAEAPEFVDAVGLDGAEDSVERGAVRVNVRDDGGAQVSCRRAARSRGGCGCPRWSTISTRSPAWRRAAPA